MKSILGLRALLLCACSVSGVSADQASEFGGHTEEASVWPAGAAEKDGSEISGTQRPAYSSSEGVFKYPLPQADLRYESKQGTFIRPDANTPSGFNPRDPARGYQAPER